MNYLAYLLTVCITTLLYNITAITFGIRYPVIYSNVPCANVTFNERIKRWEYCHKFAEWDRVSMLFFIYLLARYKLHTK